VKCMDPLVRLKVIAGIVFGVLLAILSIFNKGTVLGVDFNYILLIIYFLSLIPTFIVCLLMFKYTYSIKELFTKGTLTFYCIEFLTWVVIFDVYKTVIIRILG